MVATPSETGDRLFRHAILAEAVPMFRLDQLIERAIQFDMHGVSRLSLVAIVQALLVPRGDPHGGIGLDGLLGGAAAGRGGCTGLNHGWADLIRRFRQAGFSRDADTLAGTGASEGISSASFYAVLGQSAVTSLARFAHVEQTRLLAALGAALSLVGCLLTALGHAPIPPAEPNAD